MFSLKLKHEKMQKFLKDPYNQDLLKGLKRKISLLKDKEEKGLLMIKRLMKHIFSR